MSDESKQRRNAGLLKGLKHYNDDRRKYSWQSVLNGTCTAEEHTAFLSRTKTSRKWSAERRAKFKSLFQLPQFRQSNSWCNGSRKGRKLSAATRKKISIKVRQSFVDGRNKPWRSRHYRSYAELFWQQVLDNNNVEYIAEYRVLKHDIDKAAYGAYYLDFLIANKVDLEIDGKQHMYAERIQHDIERDTLLNKGDYIVYRIQWLNPNTADNALKVKEQIEKLLTFLRECSVIR